MSFNNSNPNKQNPNDDERAEGWPTFDEETGQLTYLLDTSTIDNPETIQWPWAKKCAFWNEYLPKLNTQTGKETNFKVIAQARTYTPYFIVHLTVNFPL